MEEGTDRMSSKNEGQMTERKSDEKQLEDDYKAHEHARDADSLAQAAARAQAKGTMR